MSYAKGGLAFSSHHYVSYKFYFPWALRNVWLLFSILFVLLFCMEIQKGEWGEYHSLSHSVWMDGLWCNAHNTWQTLREIMPQWSPAPNARQKNTAFINFIWFFSSYLMRYWEEIFFQVIICIIVPTLDLSLGYSLQLEQRSKRQMVLCSCWSHAE